MPLSLDGNGAIGGVTTVNNASLLHYNDIINGDFRIAQAGTSFAAPASGTYDLDGWLNNNSSAAVSTVAQVVGSTAGSLARQVTITTVDTVIGAGDYYLDEIKIEGFNIEKYIGKTFTVAFRAKVPVVGIHCVTVRNVGGDRCYVKEINFTAANVWQDCSFTVVGGLPTTGTWNYTNGIGLHINFAHLCGTTFQGAPNVWSTTLILATANQVNDCATVGNVWAMEKVTLNLGTVAAVSEISYEQELIRCQRYYEVSSNWPIWSGTTTAASTYYLGARFAVIKRTRPTVIATDIVNSGFAAGAPPMSDIAADGFYVSKLSNASVGTGYFQFSYIASARL